MHLHIYIKNSTPNSLTEYLIFSKVYKIWVYIYGIIVYNVCPLDMLLHLVKIEKKNYRIDCSSW
jgi:hypothetical protein